MRGFFLVILLLVLLPACGGPSLDPEARVERLGQQLRCPVCRGVPIADSPSALAIEMMEVLRGQVSEGKSDEEILRFFEERYGEWVLLQPKPEGMNFLLWILPVIFILGGAGFLITRFRGPREGT